MGSRETEAEGPGAVSDAPAALEREAARETTASDPSRKLTRVLVAVLAFALAWYLLADRFTPSTSQARVTGYVVPIVPEVAGSITSIATAVDQVVSAGDPLFEIDREKYALAVARAEADLEQAGQSVGADTSGVASAEASLAEARTNLAYVTHDAEITYNLVTQGVASQRRADRAAAKVEEAQAAFEKAQSEVERARSQMGKQGQDNPKVRSAVAALRQARIDLENSIVRAPVDGGVTSVRIGPGHYASVGKPVLTFVAKEHVWIEAAMRENNLGRIEPGDRVAIALDSAPGRVFEGVVSSIGFGVSWRSSSDPGLLPKLSAPRDWLRDPQRFPVIIAFADESAFGLRREGGQADVIVFTGGGMLLEALGHLWIRVVSLLSYFY